jgi:hypothetical protein
MTVRKQALTRRIFQPSTLVAMLALPCAAQAAISGKQADDAHAGQISREEIALILEQQRLLVPGFLAMRERLEQVEEELDAVKAQLAQLNAGSAPVVPVALAQTSGAPPKIFGGGIEDKWVLPRDTYPQNELFAVLAGVLFILVLWLGGRYYARPRLRGSRQAEAAPIMKTAGNTTATAKLRVPPAAQPPGVDTGRHAAAPSRPPPNRAVKNISDDDSMLEEAGLYAANGRMDKAVGILLEIIKRNPAKVEAWTLLFSVYSALCRVADFEKAARAFLKHHKGSPSWSGIQVLGRSLDRNNSLYADQNSQISDTPLLPDSLNFRRPIGDILIEMCVLSQREILKYLDEFDPKQHGRFGGYLVARKAISIAQLDQALLQQQGADKKTKSGGLPSLQDIERFLADFDPKQHGNVTQFLASRNIGTPDQLNQLLCAPSGQKPDTNKPQTNKQTIFGELSPS